MPEDLPVRRKRTADMAGSYDWTSQLTEPGFCAAPVSCFKHVSSCVQRVSFILFMYFMYYILFIYHTYVYINAYLYNHSFRTYDKIINIFVMFM